MKKGASKVQGVQEVHGGDDGVLTKSYQRKKVRMALQAANSIRTASLDEVLEFLDTVKEFHPNFDCNDFAFTDLENVLFNLMFEMTYQASGNTEKEIDQYEIMHNLIPGMGQ